MRTFPFFFLHITRASLILAENYIFPLTGTLRKNVLVRQAIYCFKYISWTPCAWQVQRSELHRGYLKQEMGAASKWMPVEKQLHDCSSPPLWTFFPPTNEGLLTVLSTTYMQPLRRQMLPSTGIGRPSQTVFLCNFLKRTNLVRVQRAPGDTVGRRRHNAVRQEANPKDWFLVILGYPQHHAAVERAAE